MPSVMPCTYNYNSTNMKQTTKLSALVLTGALLIAACGNKEQKSEENVNENPTQEKVTKAIEVS